VATHNEIEYYNDSLSTTPEATMAAIQSFGNKPIVLIVGGYDRGLNYESLVRAIIHSKVRVVISLPTTGERVMAALAGEKTAHQIKLVSVPNLATAVQKLPSLVKSGDVVLLSPGSASFNQFKNYAERGDQFKQLIYHQLANND